MPRLGDEPCPRVVRFPDPADVCVALLCRPPEPGLAVQRHEARDAVVGRAVYEHLLPLGGVHRAEEAPQIVCLRRVEVHRNVVVAEPQRGHGARFVGEAVARIEQAEIHDHVEAGAGHVAQLRFGRLPCRAEAIGHGHEVPDVLEPHAMDCRRVPASSGTREWWRRSASALRGRNCRDGRSGSSPAGSARRPW